MSITQFFRMLWARRLLIGLSTAACLVVAVLALLILPTRYDATSRVMLDIVKPDPVTGEVIGSQWARAYTMTQIELIRDYSVAGNVAEAAGWTQSPEKIAAYQASGLERDMDFRRWLAQEVINKTSVRMVPATNILDITVTSSSPEEAAQLADLVREAYVAHTLTARREAAGRNSQWFRDQTDEVRLELIAAEKRKTDFERENGVVITGDNMDTDTARLQALASSAPMAPMVAMPGSGVAPSAAQLAQIDAAIASASRSLGPNHPGLQQLQRQRAVLAESVSREMAAQRPAANTGPSLDALYDEQQARVLRNAGAADEARRLATDVALLREQYRNTAARAAQLEQEAQSAEAGLTLLGDAVVPQDPVFPNYPLMFIGALVGGLALGVLSALAMELFWRRIRGVEELRLVDVPVLGAMGYTGDEGEPGQKQRLFNPQPGLSTS